jgi:hypothetical protein
MLQFLSCIALGELVASSDCKIFTEYFAKKNELYSELYQEMGREESEHYLILKKCLKKMVRLPDSLKAMFKGQLLYDHKSVIEKLILMHGSFEPAAFSYMMALSSYDFKDNPEYLDVKIVAKKILIDEAKHMSIGYKAIDLLKDEPEFKTNKYHFENSLKRHNILLSKIPGITLGTENFLTKQIESKFASNTKTSTRRIFGENTPL